MKSFGAGYRAAHGRAPFPWQARLAESENLPKTIDIPTGCGKTSVLDVLVWRSIEREEARRVVWVVDRRLVVDDVFRHAQGVAEAHGIRAVRWRGGMTIDESWLLEPHERAIIVSTVDQVGSRLLFRGYGVPWKSWPVYAGMLAFDTVIVLDEVHLSPHFARILEQVASLAPPPPESGIGDAIPDPLRVIQMSATPTWPNDEASGGPIEKRAFRLGDADFTHHLLRQRLGTHKRAELQKAGKSQFRQSVVRAARSLVEGQKVAVVGVVVNRVDDARAIFEELRSTSDAILLTGRIRPFDRALLLDGPGIARARPGRPRGDSEPPLFVIATQTVEVGVDLDFDALVTEAAPIVSLRQRFGRLDRLGELRETKAVIVLRAESDEDDPVYGEGLGATWKWLWQTCDVVESGKRVIDLGLAAAHEWPSAIGGQAEDLPILGEQEVEILAETHPYLNADLDVAVMLHGRRADFQSVSLVWRRELDDAPDEFWAGVVDLCPPVRAEALALPRRVARDWLARHGIKALRWRPGEEGEQVTAESFRHRGLIRHEDILIIPSRYRGNDPCGWNPDLPPRKTGEPEDQDVGFHAAFRGSEAFQGIERVCEEPENEDSLRNYSAYPLEWGIDGGIADHRDDETRSAARESLRSHLAKSQAEGEVILDAVARNGDDGLTSDLLLALQSHDLGKADRRFQVMLHDGDEIEAARSMADGELLAKSGTDWWNVAARNRAWAASGLPRGWRHEIESLARANLEEANDGDLVRHVIVAHHGRGRPWLPSTDQAERPTGQANRFWRLHSRLGAWTLGYLEALVVIADRRASEDKKQVGDSAALPLSVRQESPRRRLSQSVVDTAYVGNTYLGFMAALGTLQLLREYSVLLSWSNRRARFHGLRRDELLEAVADALTRSEFVEERTLSGDGKRLPWNLCGAGRTQLATTLPPFREELITDLERLERTLFGPWSWSDRGASLGWVPSMRNHALRARAPSVDKPFRENGALWMAWEGISVYGRRPGSDRAAGWFRGEQQQWWLVWPLWAEPATLPTIRSMLRSSPRQTGDLGATEWWSTIRTRGGGRSDEVTTPRPVRANDIRKRRISANRK